MNAEEVIEQLDNLKVHCKDMATISEIWNKDVEALDFAIKFIKENERKNA